MDDRNDRYKERTRVFRAFCDETRLRVLELLQNGEQCACVLLERVRIGQSTLSHHMKILVDSGIVTARREGKWTYYSVRTAGYDHAVGILRELAVVRSGDGQANDGGCCE